jgi:hypothetical protein
MDLCDVLTHHAPKIGFSEKTLNDQGRQRISHQTRLKNSSGIRQKTKLQ